MPDSETNLWEGDDLQFNGYGLSVAYNSRHANRHLITQCQSGFGGHPGTGINMGANAGCSVGDIPANGLASAPNDIVMGQSFAQLGRVSDPFPQGAGTMWGMSGQLCGIEMNMVLSDVRT